MESLDTMRPPSNDVVPPLTIWPDVEALIADWRTKAEDHVRCAEKYRKEWSAIYTATAGADAIRKNAADSVTSELRLARNLAEVEEQAAYHRLIAVRGSAGEPTRA